MVAAAAAASVVEATLKGIVMVFSTEMGDACTFLVVRDALRLGYMAVNAVTVCLRQVGD